MTPIANQVVRVIAETLGSEPHELAPGVRLVDDLGADSLDVVEIALGLESEFEIDMIPDEDIRRLCTVDDVVRYVEARVAGA